MGGVVFPYRDWGFNGWRCLDSLIPIAVATLLVLKAIDISQLASGTAPGTQM